jgi:glycosyltransferase involved in cell wall biosynthesis
MAAELRAEGVIPRNVFVSANWAPSGLAPAPAAAVAALRERWNLAGKFVAMYSGNLGRVHGVEALLEVATVLRDDRDIAFAFVGAGARKDSLERAARARGLTNVFFFPPQPRSTLAVSLGVGDVHFVTLQPGAERCVYPSKLYGVTKIGRPVFFVGAPEAEIARRIRKAGLGEVFERYDIAGIANALRRLQQDASRCR